MMVKKLKRNVMIHEKKVCEILQQIVDKKRNLYAIFKHADNADNADFRRF